MPTTPTTRPLPDALSLAGQRVVVTGAASGIGRATAAALARLGADLLLADIASLEGVAADLAGMGATPALLQIDLIAPGAIERLFTGGRVHALVHSAAIVPKEPWENAPDWPERFARTLAVNARLPIELGHAAIEHMAAHGGGRLVLVGSLAGWTGGTVTTVAPDYVISKGGVHALVRLLARKGAPRGVLVNAVAPGPVATPFAANMDFPREAFPLGQMASAEQLAWPLAFLCTPAASNFVGEIINVNGGVALI